MNSLQSHRDPSLTLQARTNSLELVRAPNELDGLLRAFFRAQVPEPWPELKPPATLSLRGERAAPRRPSLFRSRFILAASLLILLLGQLFVSKMFSGYTRVATDSNRGKIEATNRIDSAIPREPKRLLIPGHR
jgi:hypothetical protein